jgi:lipoprotein-releasing system ATP-binding protein
LILRPALLLADEPTGNLDKSTGRQIHKLLLELNQEMQMTLVIVTHNPDLAALMARRITIVDGALVELN